ncbi:MAG TPA: 3-oxoacyl-ACP synthase III family protein [Phycisphaerae bacterium]|nr:3-oxoacyl-ACP synthase III family protein [Phycisphaerae bacterium]
MKAALRPVAVIGSGSFLPNDPVPNSKLDEVLGHLDQAPPKVRKFMENIGPVILQRSGVEHRHFAIDPKTHKLTHTLASLAEVAARRALEAGGRDPNDVDLLLVACPVCDYSTPPTSAVLQERLGIKYCAEMEIHSNCSGVGKCMQIAFDALRSGRYKTALVTYSQLSSVYVRSCYFNQAHMTKTQAALRYILADGSGAVLLEARDDPAPGSHELIGTHVESIGFDRKAGMTAGGGVVDLVDPERQIPGMFESGSHHLDQDFTAVNNDAVPTLVLGVRRMLDSLGVDPCQVDHYVYSIPGRQLYDGNLDKVTKPFGVTPERVKFRASDTGYCGGASLLVHFDEIVRSGELKAGQTAVVYSMESSKWMSGGFVVRW